MHHHPEYKRPLQFKNVHSIVPPTPNLEEIKKTNMKLKIQKLNEPQITIMTPRSTRNLNSQGEKKKTFRNLSLVIDCQNDHSVNNNHQGEDRNYSKNFQLQDRSQHSSNHPVFNEAKSYEGKQNISIGQFNMNMKKKIKQTNNIEFKQVKSTKNKRFIQEIQPKQPLNQRNLTKKVTGYYDRRESQNTEILRCIQDLNHRSNGVSYATDFEPLTHQNHYKAQTLSSFNRKLHEFSAYVIQKQKQLEESFTQLQGQISQVIHEVNQQFNFISKQIEQLHQATMKQTTQYIIKVKSDHKSGIKQMQDIIKSINRYQNDISTHYEDIVKQLEVNCFEEIMQKYQNKLQYFEQQISFITNRQIQQPYEMILWRKLCKFVEKININGRKEVNTTFNGEREEKCMKVHKIVGRQEDLPSKRQH